MTASEMGKPRSGFTSARHDLRHEGAYRAADAEGT
jgi:hypothetical protein